MNLSPHARTGFSTHGLSAFTLHCCVECVKRGHCGSNTVQTQTNCSVNVSDWSSEKKTRTSYLLPVLNITAVNQITVIAAGQSPAAAMWEPSLDFLFKMHSIWCLLVACHVFLCLFKVCVQKPVSVWCRAVRFPSVCPQHHGERANMRSWVLSGELIPAAARMWRERKSFIVNIKVNSLGPYNE